MSSARTASAVVVRGLRKAYARGAVVLRGVDLDIAAGTSTALVGPSGSGKSTLLHLVGGMDRPDAGTVRVGDVEVTRLTDRGLAAYRRRIGFVFQRFHLLASLTVLDNVVAPVLPVRTTFDKRARAQQLLDAVGLAARACALPAQLSGGERQRVAIARALINDPVLVLADEPTGNLDSAAGRMVVELLERLQRERGLTVLMVTHDRSVAARADRVLSIRDGRLRADETAGEPP
jgi:putative ABC transport system ATP-binding protein